MNANTSNGMKLVDPQVMSTDALVARIGALQDIQRRVSPKENASQIADALITPCFDEMARRQRDGALCCICRTHDAIDGQNTCAFCDDENGGEA